MSPSTTFNAPFKIITADERLKETRGIKGVLTGISGIGKTSQLWTLDPAHTLFLNLEAGELAVQGWPGDEIRIRDWERARDLACWIGGANPAMREDQSYSRQDYERVCAVFGDPARLDKYETIFVDSISVASRICFGWCKGQPQAQSDRSGKPDLRGAYGLLGQEMIGWLTHLQHTQAKNIWLVGLLDKRLDDLGKAYFSLQVEGSKTGLELRHFRSEQVGLAGDLELLIPKSINRLRLKGSGSRYVHGGASLQEVVIPVVRINKKRKSDVSSVDVEIIGSSNRTITTSQLSVRFYQTQPATDKFRPRILIAGIYSITGELISDRHDLTFDYSSENARERETSVRFLLSRNADAFDGQEIFLKLEEQPGETTHYREYQKLAFTLRRSFSNDFDF